VIPTGKAGSRWPIVVVGAGAAGLMAAIHAAGGTAPVILLERTSDGGRKILISGGGRCNVLPSELDPRDFVTESSPNTLRKILRSWPLEEQRGFFEEVLGLRLVLEADTGKLFPEGNRARDIRDSLVAEARRRGVELRFGSAVAGLEPHPGGGWRVLLEGSAPPLRAGAVILATGGLSVPATGSDGSGLRMARELGHRIHTLYPALTPLTESPARHAVLAGVSLPVTVEAPGTGRQATGGFLFTHRGFSGPSVLNVSDVAVRSRLAGSPAPLTVAWTSEGSEVWDRRIREGTGTVGSTLRPLLPTRLADQLLAEAAVESDRPLYRLRREERLRLVEALARWPLPWTGDEGYKKAEVTGGGVALDQVSPRNLESRQHPGLFLCGEILDAFGPIGGYNFAWAWATGRAAGSGARTRMEGEARGEEGAPGDAGRGSPGGTP